MSQKIYIPKPYTVPRDILELNKIITFMGARRVGKTTLMYQTISELQQSGIIKQEQVVFLDFSNIPLDTQVQGYELIHAYRYLYPDLQPRFLFDEVQNVGNMTQFLLQLYNEGYKLFITGSNSKLLSSELATQLRGRSYDIHVFPLTPKEYLLFQGSILDPRMIIQEKHQILRQISS